MKNINLIAFMSVLILSSNCVYAREAAFEEMLSGAKGSGIGAEEVFINSLAPAALAQVQLPASVLPSKITAEVSSRGMNSIPASLKAAVKAAQRKELTDYGYLFGLSTYPANTRVTRILADIIGCNEADMGKDAFKMSSGDKAVRAFKAYFKSEAAVAQEDPSPENLVIAKNLANVGAEAEKAFLGATQFTNIQLALHGRTEDGDMDYVVLIAQEKDGTLQVLQYTRNPY